MDSGGEFLMKWNFVWRSFFAHLQIILNIFVHLCHSTIFMGNDSNSVFDGTFKGLNVSWALNGICCILTTSLHGIHPALNASVVDKCCVRFYQYNAHNWISKYFYAVYYFQFSFPLSFTSFASLLRFWFAPPYSLSWWWRVAMWGRFIIVVCSAHRFISPSIVVIVDCSRHSRQMYYAVFIAHTHTHSTFAFRFENRGWVNERTTVRPSEIDRKCMNSHAGAYARVHFVCMNVALAWRNLSIIVLWFWLRASARVCLFFG